MRKTEQTLAAEKVPVLTFGQRGSTEGRATSFYCCVNTTQTYGQAVDKYNTIIQGG
jgi:hypothetical protein